MPVTEDVRRVSRRARSGALAAAVASIAAAGAYACGSSDSSGSGSPDSDPRRDSGSVFVPRDSSADPDSATPDAGTIAGHSTVAVGGTFACILAKDRSVSCWGKNDVGQLGRDPAATPSCGAFPCSPAPTRVEGLPRIVKLALGDDFACALDEGRAVWCWGSNAKGQLETTPESTSFRPRRLIVDALELVATASHACVITTNQLVRCWGENTCQIFGPAGSPTPIARVVPGVPAMKQISIGTDAMCGTRLDGTVLCWGADHRGSLGHDLQPASPLCDGLAFDPTPKSVQAKANDLPITDVADVHIGAGVACARHLDGKVICWGDNGRGALGQGIADTKQNARAVEVPGVSAAQLDLHGQTPCVIIANRLLCWGDGQFGQLESLAPNPLCGGQSCKALGYAITNMMPVRELSSGAGSIAAIKDDLSVWMWGRNTSAEAAIAPTDPTNQVCAGDACILQPKQVGSLPPLD